MTSITCNFKHLSIIWLQKNALVTVNSVIHAQERNTPQTQPGMQGWHAGALPWSTPVTSFLKDNVILIYNSSKDAFTWFWISYKWNHTTVHFSCLVALAHSAGSDFLLYASRHGRTPRQGPIQPCRRAQVPVRDTLSTFGHSHVSICKGRQWPSASLTCTSLITMKISTCVSMGDIIVVCLFKYSAYFLHDSSYGLIGSHYLFWIQVLCQVYRLQFSSTLCRIATPHSSW